MVSTCTLLIGLCLFIGYMNVLGLKEGGLNVCTTRRTVHKPTYRKCGWLWRKRCKTGEKSVIVKDHKCCTGYSNVTYTTLSWLRMRTPFRAQTTVSTCPYALCAGKTTEQGACNTVDHGDVRLRNHSHWTSAGGHCATPNRCAGCRRGFFSSGAHCRACPAPSHCYLAECTNLHDSKCTYCEGETTSTLYAFTRFTNGGKSCERACSWRPGYRCYPGTCSDNLFSNCNCSDGFSGGDCNIITQNPDILKNSLVLTYAGERLDVPANPKENTFQLTVWTNKKDFNNAVMTLQASFNRNLPLPLPPYIKDRKVGIVYGSIKLDLLRGGSSTTQSIYKRCGSSESPQPTSFDCTLTQPLFLWSSYLPFQHEDRLVFQTDVRNGGFVKYINGDYESLPQEQYTLQPRRVIRTFYVRFDFEAPSHCIQNINSTCGKQPLIVPEITRERNITISWEAWTDDLSGVHKYLIDLFHLIPDGPIEPSTRLKLGDIVKKGVPPEINATETEARILLPSPGPYAIQLVVQDKAGNEKTTRRLLLYDDDPEVELINNTYTRINTAAPETGYEWINHPAVSMQIQWSNRFLNRKHESKIWLNAVTKGELVKELDDYYGIRQVNRVDNVRGIVKFEVGYDAIYNGTISRNSYVTVPDLHAQKWAIKENITDGKRFTIKVRAYDIMNSYAEDIVNVTVDLSPPTISNLWLKKEEKRNLSVHSKKEFTKMTIEWEAVDEQSGLESISWIIFDNYTGTEIVHGSASMSPQPVSKCNTSDEACYCTPYSGCFNGHYILQPHVSSKNDGLLAKYEKGLHDGDYYLQIKARNKAFLTTVAYLKVTIDTSPPLQGSVHDGKPGDPEVDFQQSHQLNAYWDGFFDKESGIMLYKYGFASACLPIETFADNSSNHYTVLETRTKFATHTVTSEGTYFVTVVAYNAAYEPSKPVCSDGVTIDTSQPKIVEFAVEQARTRERLITLDNKTVWFLDSTRRLHKLTSVDAKCRKSVTSIDANAFELLPQDRYKNGTLKEMTGDTACRKQLTRAQGIVFYLPSITHLRMKWKNPSPDRVFDYEIGLSSTNSTMPDKMVFMSTKQHAHQHISYPNIKHGETFYILIKTISKSSMTSIQVDGPFTVDTRAPVFTGKIQVSYVQGFLVAKWNSSTFVDGEDVYGLQYKFAVGHEKFRTTVLSFSPLSIGPGCKSTSGPVMCTALKTNMLEWHIHGHHRCYVTIMAENTVGLTTKAASEPYIHDIQSPSAGVVLDVDNSVHPSMKDIDFQTDVSEVGARWFGFHHPHLDITYTVCVGNTSDVSAPLRCENVGNATSFTERLSLVYFQTYFFKVVATTKAGKANSVSDGVTILKENNTINDVKVYDGHPCIKDKDASGRNVSFSHHSKDIRQKCQADVYFQSTQNVIEAHIVKPVTWKRLAPDIYWEIEEKAEHTPDWFKFKPYTHLKTSSVIRDSNLVLNPGRTYRVAVKLCAGSICYSPVYSTGVTVIPNPPVTGSLDIAYSDTHNKLMVTFAKFYDPDIAEMDAAINAISFYEWAFTDNAHCENILTQWSEVRNSTEKDSSHLTLTIQLSRNITFNKCWRVAIRGYNKVGLSSVVSAEIKDCDNITLIKPKIILDAVGPPVENKIAKGDENRGQTILLPENAQWESVDADYSPFSNILSAVWPSLRYNSYVWGVIEYTENDPTIFYERKNHIHVSDPCSHPQVIQCGTTDKDYINIAFDPPLEHGKRYITCIHANETEIIHEKWSDTLPEINVCTDGVTIDLTPPEKGDVWIGTDTERLFQSSSTELSVNWNSFQDIEEFGTHVHATGIRTYHIAIGSSPGSIDVMPWSNVGITNHISIHNITLQNGHTYFVSVKAFDFVNRSSVSVSNGVTIDVSPPSKSNNPITVGNRHISNKEEVKACWRNVFSDKESGIIRYEWSIGSDKGYDDIMAFSETDDECGVSARNVSFFMKEGHAYYVSVRCTNGAGLSSLATSWAFHVEGSAPIVGHVYDGFVFPNATDVMDKDFQTSGSKLFIRWEGFHDAHSVIQQYHIGIGTCPYCDDVVPCQPVGITNEFVVANLHLAEGVKYYSRVTACNTADLCSSGVSDGIIVDSSPPRPGRVFDGFEAEDIQYQASRNSLGAKWFGFADSQSGISHYTWRVGTRPYSDDLLPAMEIHVYEFAVISDLNAVYGHLLPTRKTVYITVRAFNGASLYSEAVSNGFIVDDTAPNITQSPTWTDIGSVYPNTSVYRGTIRVTWQATDDESYIDRQYISIMSHVGGDFNISSIKLDGIVRDYTLTALDLHDGSFYCVTMVVCNGAKICTSAMSDRFLVDSSPPTPGMFAIETQHAAHLTRQPSGWMKWSIYSIKLAWLGFVDVHSGIHHYKIAVGSTYMGTDLNEIPGTYTTIQHNEMTTFNAGDEGGVQTTTLKTQSLNRYSHVYISIWAVNGVGLPSAIVHSQFKLGFNGKIELVRRCSAVTCAGHCVCAPHGQTCSSMNCSSAAELDDSNVVVIDTQDLKFPDQTGNLHFVPSNTLLAAKWTVTPSHGEQPQWYEWSVGLSSNKKPGGVFSIHERQWHHSGQLQQYIFSTPRGQTLSEDVQYSFFVRAWFSNNTYAIGKSDGVTIETQPPSTTNKLGKAVKELANGTNDVDYISEDQMCIVDWQDKFIDSHERISRFRVYISTRPGGHDVHVSDTSLPPSQSSYKLTSVKLQPNVRYYTNVQAYNHAGLHTTVTSDGFLLDVLPPEAGTVFDGEGFRNIDYQNSSSRASSFWHGFSDQESGIRGYRWCMSEDHGDHMCSVLPETDVGLHISASRLLSDSLKLGIHLVSKVYAVDGVGHHSNVAISTAVVVDTTPPEREQRQLIDANYAKNPSFEDDTSGLTWQEFKAKHSCMKTAPKYWSLHGSSCTALLKTKKEFTTDGYNFVFIQGVLVQTLSNTKVGETYQVTFYCSHLPFHVSMISNKEGFISFGEEKHVFLMYNKPARADHEPEVEEAMLSWHHHVFYFKARAEHVTLKIGSSENSEGIAIDNIKVQEYSRLEMTVSRANVKAHAVLIEDWSSIHASWSFSDAESPIVDYMWAIGYTEGGAQLQKFQTVGLRTFGYNSSIEPVHGSSVHVTVVATNAAGLMTVSYSNPVVIDLTPPTIVFVNDGLGSDVDFQDTSLISASWEVYDAESEIEACQWMAGFTNKSNGVLSNFTDIEHGRREVTQYFDVRRVEDKDIFVTIRCKNKAGLVGVKSSDGVKVVHSLPSSQTTQVEIIGSKLSQYLEQDNFNGDPNNMKLKWTGFAEDIGINSFLVELNGKSTHVSEVVNGRADGYTYATLEGFHLKDGQYSIAVTGVSQLGLHAQKTWRNVTVLTEKPRLNDQKLISITWNSGLEEAVVQWQNVFLAEYPLYYEVSVGTFKGGADIIQWQETKETLLKFALKRERVGSSGTEIFVFVRAISPSGTFNNAQGEMLVTVA